MKGYGNLSFTYLKEPFIKTFRTYTLRLYWFNLCERGTIVQWKVYERGIIWQWKVYERGTFSAKNWYTEKGKGSDLGAEPSRINFFLVPPPPRI